ncbi:MFS transporter [Sciscionella sediminilitoris]|uniref:MFS transporter n=1 Tax=Sciscionella sediminilitoris TaxID=1445613 RepID=UPI000AAEE869|nr:MFS transporter [Sciscionella sp. SE31]
MTETSAAPPRMGRIAVASFIGTAIEFYDFYLYATASALVINKQFFPNLGATVGQLAAFSTFAVAFIARPLGSLFFGHFGDRIGRKSMLIASLLTMGISTVAIGLIPGYATIGIAAPILLVVLRFAQGIGLGGEWGGAALLAAEHAPKGKRGWYGMYPQLGPSIGFFFASGGFLLLSATMDESTFNAWGWRVPFLASALLVLVGLFVRLRIAETPEFSKVLDSGDRARMPLVEMARRAPWRLLGGSGAIVVCYVLFYTATTFCISYGTSELHLSKQTMLTCAIIAVWAMALATIGSSIASDRFSRRSVLIVGCGYAVVVGLVMFPLIDTGNPVLICVALALALAGMGWTYGPLGAYLPELFAVRYRYSASSFAYNLGGVLGGALAPNLATLLFAAYGGFSVGLYVAGAAVLSLVCVIALPPVGKAAKERAHAKARL